MKFWIIIFIFVFFKFLWVQFQCFFYCTLPHIVSHIIFVYCVDQAHSSRGRGKDEVFISFDFFYYLFSLFWNCWQKYCRGTRFFCLWNLTIFCDFIWGLKTWRNVAMLCSFVLWESFDILLLNLVIFLNLKKFNDFHCYEIISKIK